MSYSNYDLTSLVTWTIEHVDRVGIFFDFDEECGLFKILLDTLDITFYSIERRFLIYIKREQCCWLTCHRGLGPTLLLGV